MISSFVAVGATLTPQPTDARNATIFAGGNLRFESFTTVSGGPVAANGNVHHQGGTLNVGSMFAGGQFTRGSNAFQNATGDILFNGTINEIGGPGSDFAGSIVSGGNVTIINSSTVAQDVIAAGNVNIPFSFGLVEGNVQSGGTVNLNGDVLGNVTHATGLNLGAFASVGSSSVGGPVTPTAYQSLQLPALRPLISTGPDVVLANFQDLALSPGNYGMLDFASGNKVTLTAGQYVFSGIQSSFSLNELDFDTTGGAIDVFVASDLTFDFRQLVNGKQTFGLNAAKRGDSVMILIEVAGNFLAKSDLYGTLLAPEGNIEIQNAADITGRILAGGNVIIGDSDVTTIPEVSPLILLALVSVAAYGCRGAAGGRSPLGLSVSPL